MEITAFDWAALGVIAASMILSAMRGLVGEIVAFTGWIVALLVARVFAVGVADGLLPQMQPRSLAVVCGFVSVYVVARITLALLSRLLEGVLKTAHLSGVNRFLGALLGAIKGVLVMAIAVFLLSFSELPKTQAWRDALSAPFFEQLVLAAKQYLPSFIAEQTAFRQPEKELRPDNGQQSVKEQYSEQEQADKNGNVLETQVLIPKSILPSE